MVKCILKKSNFEFLIKIKFQESHFIKTCYNMKLVHQENQKSKFLWKSQSSKHLETFLSVKKKYDTFRTSGQIFIMIQDDSGRTSDTRVVDLNEI